MSTGPAKFHGVVHGKTVELDHESGLPDGQHVSVTIEPARISDERLKRAFGSWAPGGEELDQFIEKTREDRKNQRSDQPE